MRQNAKLWCPRGEKNINLPYLQRPGIEPGSVPWQGTILPLDQRCCWTCHLRAVLGYIKMAYAGNCFDSLSRHRRACRARMRGRGHPEAKGPPAAAAAGRLRARGWRGRPLAKHSRAALCRPAPEELIRSISAFKRPRLWFSGN